MHKEYATVRPTISKSRQRPISIFASYAAFSRRVYVHESALLWGLLPHSAYHTFWAAECFRNAWFRSSQQISNIKATFFLKPSSFPRGLSLFSFRPPPSLTSAVRTSQRQTILTHIYFERFTVQLAISDIWKSSNTRSRRKRPTYIHWPILVGPTEFWSEFVPFRWIFKYSFRARSLRWVLCCWSF